MATHKPSYSKSSSSISLFSKDEMMAMDDTEFFDYLEQELGSDYFSPSSSETEEFPEIQEELPRTSFSFPNQNLDFDEFTDQLSDLELSSSSENHFPVFQSPNLPNSVHFCNFPKGNYEVKPPRLPDLITLVPETSVFGKTLSNSQNDGVFHSFPTEHKYTIYRVVDKVPPVNSEETCLDERHLGNSFNPSRRVDVYKAFVRQLNSSDFPFSYEQRKMIAKLDGQVSFLSQLSRHESESIFTNFRDEELKLKADLDLLFELFADIDYHPVSPTLINRYVAAIISELEFWIERDPMIPIVIPGKLPFFVDPAAYLISKLVDVFPDSTEEKIETAFFARRKESHIKLTQIFSFSKYPFTSTQKDEIRELSNAVMHTTGDPDSQEEKEFLDLINKLVFNLTFDDQGPRDGLSNPKKIRKAFNKLVSDLTELGLEERKFLGEFECFCLHPADLIFNVINQLSKSFLPQNILSEGRISTNAPRLGTNEL